MVKLVNNIHAILFDLPEDLSRELASPLQLCTVRTESVSGEQASDIRAILDARADMIFCGAEANIVTGLRTAKPFAPIIVVSRHAEVTNWLDAIEAGATDYCAAPFENAQIKWIVESSMRNTPGKAAAAAAA
jgi:FixJ family two-component response regulator